MTNNMEELIRKVAYLDLAAADYVRQRIQAGTVNIAARSIGSLFIWIETPQGHAYWNDIQDRLYRVPNITALGNEF